MSTATYTTSFPTALAFNAHPTGTLSAISQTIPDAAIVKSVKMSVYCGVSSYNASLSTCFTLTDAIGNTLSIESTVKTGSDNRIWAEFGGSPSASINWNNLSSVMLYGTDKLTVRTGYTATLTIEYDEYTACGAPTTVQLSKTLSRDNVTLSWSGATAGIGNAITGYEVQRAESIDGKVWGEWGNSAVTTEASLSVAPPTTPGNYYNYRVRTRGSAGADYYSPWKVSANTLRRDHEPLAGFTDDPLAVDVTPVKALHMQELQTSVAALRAFYGLATYAFTNIVAGETSLAGWTAHVMEIRAAIDEIGKDHENWIEITENKPRADVMQQLREVVLAI